MSSSFTGLPDFTISSKAVFDEEKQAVLDAKENPETVNYLVGKLMQKTKGKADPTKTLELIKSKLG